MIKFREQHQSSLAWVSLNHLFQLSESACLLGRFCEFNQIQPPNRIFQCGHDSLEWHGRCHAKTLDLESSDGHFHTSSLHRGPALESTRLNLHWGDAIVGDTGTRPRAPLPCRDTPVRVPPCQSAVQTDSGRIKVSSAEIAGSGRETHCDTER